MKDTKSSIKVVDTVAGPEYLKLLDEHIQKRKELDEKYPYVKGQLDCSIELQNKRKELNEEFQRKTRELLKKYNLT